MSFYRDLDGDSTVRRRERSHDNDLARSPQRTRTDARTIATPTERNPSNTVVSCHGLPLCPAAVIGERTAVPKTAAIDVTNQFPYVPYRTVRFAIPLVRGDSLTSFQTAPSAIRNVPFITPSKCAASPMRVLAKCVSAKPVNRPIRNRNMPCHMRLRLVDFIWILFSFTARRSCYRSKTDCVWGTLASACPVCNCLICAAPSDGKSKLGRYQKAPSRLLRGPVYYIGRDVHKLKTRYCVKHVFGRRHAGGWIPTTRFLTWIDG